MGQERCKVCDRVDCPTLRCGSHMLAVLEAQSDCRPHAVDWRQRALEAEARERWVSVDERLPEVGQRVLVWRKGIGGAYESDYAEWGFRHSRDVSHWRPMPAATEVP